MTSYKTQSELKRINRFLKSPDCPPPPQGVDRIAFGKICLENFLDEQLNREQRSAYDNFYEPTPEPISDEYDLGSWQNG